MADLELIHIEMFAEDGDSGWHAGQLDDGRRVHAAAILCAPRTVHWSGSVEDATACECHGAGTCNPCLIRADGGLVFTKVTGCYRSANSAVRALKFWASNPDAPPPPAPFNCRWTTMQAILCDSEPDAPPMPLGTTEHPIYTTNDSGNSRKLAAEDGDHNALHLPDGFEFTAEPDEDPSITLFRQIAKQQITRESLDECSAVGHPRQAWAIISGTQKGASPCSNCGQMPNFVEDSSSMDVRGFMYMDTLTEQCGDVHGKTTRIKHSVEEHIEQGNLIFRFSSVVFEGYTDIEGHDEC